MTSADFRDALVADVGGTNTRVALARQGQVRPMTIQRFRNEAYPSLLSILQEYLSTTKAPAPTELCVAVAGPVNETHARLTNLEWDIHKERLKTELGAQRVMLLNDLQAQGHALDHLDAAQLKTILPGAQNQAALPRLVVGIGTGFNIAPVLGEKAHRLVPPSEAGHASLPLVNARDMEFAAYLRQHGHSPAIEEALSGRGLQQIYGFLTREQPRELASGARIVEHGLARIDPIATDALELFVTYLGRVLGDLALAFLPHGGIYLAGGMARAFADHYSGFGLAEAMQDKGRFADFVGQFGVYIIEDDYAALTGAAAYLLRLPRR